MAQLEHIKAIEKRLWSAAEDMLRANSNYASNECFLPVMELVFLRPTAQFDTLVALPDGADRAKVIIDAMESIKADYENLCDVLPKSEYQELDNAVLGQLLRTLNPEEFKPISWDVFGRIHEYLLTRFSDQKAHDLIEICETECDTRDRDAWSGPEIPHARKTTDEARALAIEKLKQIRYFWRQAHWLTERFPDAKLREIHVELDDLNSESVQLAATINKNIKELGV